METKRILEQHDLGLTDEDGRAIGMRSIKWQSDNQYMLRLQATRDGELHGSSKPPYTCSSVHERTQLLESLLAQSRSRFIRRIRAKAAKKVDEHA